MIVYPGRWTDLLGTLDSAAGAAALTYEPVRDTPVRIYWFRHNQADALSIRYQLPHHWDLTEVQPHMHVLPAGPTSGNLVLDGYYVWTRPGLIVPELASWTPFTATKALLDTDQYREVAFNLFASTPPANCATPSANLWVHIARNPTTDTYEGSKPTGTAAANVGLVYADCHYRSRGFGTFETYPD